MDNATRLAPTGNSSQVQEPREVATASLVKEMSGDILKTPADSLVLHSCNCEGRWGAGVADALRQKFPAAFRVYNQHCLSHKDRWKDLLGTALLIAPQAVDKVVSRPRWIGCLFTKISTGRPEEPFGHLDIYEATRMALEDLGRKLRLLPHNVLMGGMFCPLINAGIFAVPWSVTRRQLQETGLAITVLVLVGNEAALETDEAATRAFVKQVTKQRQRQVRDELADSEALTWRSRKCK